MSTPENVIAYELYQLANAPDKRIGLALGEQRILESGVIEEDTIIFHIQDDQVSGTIVTDIFQRNGDFRSRIGDRRQPLPIPEGSRFELSEPFQDNQGFEAPGSPVEAFKSGIGRVVTIPMQQSIEYPTLRIISPVSPSHDEQRNS